MSASKSAGNQAKSQKHTSPRFSTQTVIQDPGLSRVSIAPNLIGAEHEERIEATTADPVHLRLRGKDIGVDGRASRDAEV
jgi:hypothetical protein